MKTTLHMPSAMKAVCNRVIDQNLDATELDPSAIDLLALRWAWPLAKKAGKTKGESMLWFHKQRNQWIKFEVGEFGRIVSSLSDESGGKELRLALGLGVSS